MNKPMKLVRRSTMLTLGDLVVAVSSCSHNTVEAAAAINDLLGRRCVTLAPRRRKLRVTI